MEGGLFITSVLQMGKLRPRNLQDLAYGQVELVIEHVSA